MFACSKKRIPRAVYRNEVRQEQNDGQPGRMAGSTERTGIFHGGLLRGRGSGKDNCRVFAVSGLSCNREPENTEGGLKHGNRYAGL